MTARRTASRTRRAVAPAALALALLTPIPAAAQSDARETADALAGDWLSQVRGYAPPVVRYARDCIVDALMAAPEASRSIVLAADAFGAGLAALQDADAEALDALLPEIDACVQTMDFGEAIYDWVIANRPELRLLERDPVAACAMDAVRPIPEVAKHIIYLGDDFAHGLAVAAVTVPDDVAGLQEAVAACLP